MYVNLYRVWHKKEKHFLNPNNLMLSPDGLIWWQFGYSQPRLLEQDDLLINWYTELEDKNGKAIFEEDILLGSSGIEHRIQFVNGRFMCRNLQNHALIVARFSARYFEITGNIYENPELLDKNNVRT
jgi:hypothetical protein